MLRSLRSGVVPRTGLQYIQVGRNEEIKSFIRDIDTIADGGTSFRIVIGEYGAGKTFFLSLARSIALEKGLVTMNGDLSPTKRLYGTNGMTRSFISELVTSLSTRTKPEGGALQGILDKFLSRCLEEAKEKGVDSAAIAAQKLADFNERPGGFAFSRVVALYCQGYDEGDEAKRQAAIRWLRAEYSTRTESLRDTGVREFIGDDSFFNTLVLYSELVRKAGYKGLFVCIDEMVNLYKIVSAANRKANYEQILSMLNQTLQGNVEGLGFVLSGTPEFLTDPLRGLYSYEALRSRLAENSFSAKLGVKDFNSTVMRLANLSQEELFLLLKNIRNVFAYGKKEEWLVPDEALLAFLSHCANKIGDAYFRTPRTTIKSFIDLLSMLEQYPDKSWTDVIEQIDIRKDTENSTLSMEMSENKLSPSDNSSTSKEEDDLFATFKL